MSAAHIEWDLETQRFKATCGLHGTDSDTLSRGDLDDAGLHKGRQGYGRGCCRACWFYCQSSLPSKPSQPARPGTRTGQGRPTGTPLGSRETDINDGPQGTRKNQQTHLTEDAPATPLTWNLSVAEPGVLGSDPVLKTGDTTANVCFYGRDRPVHLVPKYTQMLWACCLPGQAGCQTVLHPQEVSLGDSCLALWGHRGGILGPGTEFHHASSLLCGRRAQPCPRPALFRTRCRAHRRRCGRAKDEGDCTGLWPGYPPTLEHRCQMLSIRLQSPWSLMSPRVEKWILRAWFTSVPNSKDMLLKIPAEMEKGQLVPYLPLETCLRQCGTGSS